MHGRRGTGVERRKRGHSWYQSSVCTTSFSPHPLYRCTENWTGEGVLPLLVLLFFFNLHSPLKVIGELSLSPTEAQMSHMESWIAIAPASSPAFILPLPSSHAVWPSRFVSGHLLQRAQGDTWLLRHRWVAVSPASWRPPVGPRSLFSPL